jgi:hypothetical protein
MPLSTIMEVAADGPPTLDILECASERALTDMERRERACQHILAAYTSEQPVYVRRTGMARRINWLVHRFRTLKWLAILFLVALTVYERPVWCIRNRLADGRYPCDTKLYPGWGHKYMTLADTFAWEGACLLTLLSFEAGHIFAGAQHVRVILSSRTQPSLTLS